jgi:hypothetical protein
MDVHQNLGVSELSDSNTEDLEPTSVNRLCLRCKSMFSSLQSLRSLVSEEGYEHYSIKEAGQHADAGCSFCSELLRFWLEEDDDDKPIFLKAAYNNTPIQPNLDNVLSYPSSIFKMSSLVSAAESAVDDIEINICAPSGKHLNLALLPLSFNFQPSKHR